MRYLFALLIALAASMSLGEQIDTLVLQNGLDGYDGCEDRSLFQIKTKGEGGSWGGASYAAFPRKPYHTEDASEGDNAHLAFGSFLC